MTLSTNVQNLATRVATEVKALRTLINGNAADLSALTTADKTTLVAAINELDAAVDAAASSGGATNLDQLTDVTLGTLADNQIITYDNASGQWINEDGTALFQPRDGDLDAIAALATTTYGRAFLTLANQAGLMGLLLAGSTTDTGIVRLATVAEADTGTSTAIAVTPAGLASARTAIRDEILGTDVPAALDTLDELAAALGDDANFAATVNTALANRVRVDTATQGLTAQQQQNARTNISAVSQGAYDTFVGNVGATNTDYVATFEAGLT